MKTLIYKSILTLAVALFFTSCTKSLQGSEVVNNKDLQPIFGGEVVAADDNSLDGVLKKSHINGFCSSIQISKSLILTAAHCTAYLGKKYELSKHSKNKNDFNQSSIFGEIHVHPLYIDMKHANDLALTTLNDDLILNSMDNFNLPDSATLPEELYIAGYGQVAFTEDQNAERVLKRLKLSKSKQRLNEISKETLGDDQFWETSEAMQLLNQSIKNGNLYCFKSLEKKTDFPFSGDSGGPLYSIDQNGNKTVHGVFSIFIYENVNQDYYFYCYESVFPKLSWIKKISEKKTQAVRAGVKVDFLNKSIDIENRIIPGVEISESRESKGEIIDGKFGRLEDLSSLDLKGKIVLIKRGNILFSDKIDNVLSISQEVAGILIYNNSFEDLFSPDSNAKVGKTDIRFISLKDGEVILSEINMGTKVEAILTLTGSEK